MNVGYVARPRQVAAVKRLELVTKTPGFTIRVLGARGGKPPAKIDDADWVVLGEAGSVDAKPATGAAAPAVAPAKDDKPGDTRLRLDLAAEDEIFRHVLLWVSAPPTGRADGPLQQDQAASVASVRDALGCWTRRSAIDPGTKGAVQP